MKESNIFSYPDLNHCPLNRHIQLVEATVSHNINSFISQAQGILMIYEHSKYEHSKNEELQQHVDGIRQEIEQKIMTFREQDHIPELINREYCFGDTDTTCPKIREKVHNSNEILHQNIEDHLEKLRSEITTLKNIFTQQTNPEELKNKVQSINNNLSNLKESIEQVVTQNHHHDFYRLKNMGLDKFREDFV